MSRKTTKISIQAPLLRTKVHKKCTTIAHKSAQINKISILKLEGTIKKISYERRDYESVDEKSLSTKKRIHALKG